MDCPGDYPQMPVTYTTSSHWFKNSCGWCKQQILSYHGGYSQRDYVEWGLSDQEYFKRKLEGNL